MADKQKMEITILPNGEVSIKVLCVPGPSCESVSAALEQSLGKVKAKEKTAATNTPAMNALAAFASQPGLGLFVGFTKGF